MKSKRGTDKARMEVSSVSRRDIRGAWLVVNGEVEPQELADPMVLWNGGKALIQQVLEAIVISTN